MRTTLAFVAVLFLASAGSAQAAGCLSGAVVGGVAGHVAGHGKLGAAAGCAIGHHKAKKQKQQEQQRTQQQPQGLSIGACVRGASSRHCAHAQSHHRRAGPSRRQRP